jgi:hypothetical protein
VMIHLVLLFPLWQSKPFQSPSCMIPWG